MQPTQLLVSSIIDFAERNHPNSEIVTRRCEPGAGIHRETYAQMAARSKRLANALHRLGVVKGTRVATLVCGWRTALRAAGGGAVTHA